MNKLHFAMLTRAASLYGQFDVDGEPAKIAYELLKAQLIEGEPLLDPKGLPVRVAVLGITIAGRNALANRHQRFKDWLFNVISIIIGSVLTIFIQRYCLK